MINSLEGTINSKTPRCFTLAVFAMLILGISYFTITLMAGLYIASDLGGSQDIAVYGTVFYGLANAVSIPVSLYLTDRLGAFRLATLSLLFYTGFSLCCAYASTYFLFNLFRFGMGLSAGPFYFLCRYFLDLYSSEEKKASQLSLMMLCYAVVPVVGASFGSWLAYESHWRWLFHFNEPIALALAFYFWYASTKLDEQKQPHAPFDSLGFATYAIAVTALATAGILGQELDWQRSPTFVALLWMGIPSALLFLVWELKHPHPFIDLKLLSNPTLFYALLNVGLLFSSYFGMIILIALWLKIYANYTPYWIALLLINMAIAGSIGYLLLQRVFRFLDPRVPLALAILFFLSSCLYSTTFNPDVDFFHLSVARFMAGLGLVLFLVPLFRLAFNCCPPSATPQVFVFFQAARTIGSSLGAALFVTLWQRRQVFFHERLGEALTINAPLTNRYYQQAIDVFHLTKEQATEQLNLLLNREATSLGLNDTFGFMALLLFALFLLLLASFVIKPLQQGIRDMQKKL